MVDMDPDILAITVHGTQSISLKEDYSEYFLNAVKIKSEIEDEETQDIPKQHNLKLRCAPLVYTTRLDDMNALNKIKQSSSKQFTDMILAESKPRYEYLRSQVKRENNISFTSYIQLSACIQELNYKAEIEENLRQHEIRVRNEKLLEACKPLRIVLEDINKALQVKDKVVDESSPCIENIIIFSDDNLASTTPLIKLKPANDVIVALKGYASQETDIYVVGAKGLKKYYKTHLNDFYALQQSYKTNKIILVEYCCWVERDKNITLLAKSGTCGMANKCAFLRNTHNCPKGLCLCCCREVSGVYKVRTDDAQNNVRNFIKTTQFTDGIMKKAANFNILTIPKIVTAAEQPRGDVARSVVIIKYKGLILQQTKKLGEHYEIGPTGDIDRYVIPTVNHTVTEQITIYRRNDKLKMINRIFYFELICCWYKRQNFLDQIKNLKPNVLKFIKSSHLCGTEKCDCCCKPVHIVTPLENIYKSNQNKPRSHDFRKKQIPTSNTCKITANKAKRPVLVQRFENILDVNKTINTMHSNPQTSPETGTPPTSGVESEATLHGRANLQINESRNNADKLRISLQDNIDLTIDANYKPPPNHIIRTQVKSTVSNQVIPEGLESTILNGVLGRFKDLKLVAGENGKLTATINAPPGSMTPVEIKVLSDILSLASVQIAHLGITAEGFCNRVNTLRANGQIGLPVPQLVPIVNTRFSKPPTVSVSAPPSAPLAKTEVKAKATPTVPSKIAQREPEIPSKTCDKSCIYESISSLGGTKNSQFVFAYDAYFKRQDLLKFSPPQKTSTLTITDVRTLIENEPSLILTSKREASKPSNRWQVNTSNKKQCVQSLVKILPNERQTPLTHTQPILEHSHSVDTANSSQSQKSSLQQMISQSLPTAGIDNDISIPQPLQVFGNNALQLLFSGESCTAANIQNGHGTGMSVVPNCNASIPVQNPIYTSASALNATDIGVPAPDQNPILYSLITQRSAQPPAVKALPVAADLEKTLVAPLILAHSDPSCPPKRKRRKLIHNTGNEYTLQITDAVVESNIRNIKTEKMDFINIAPHTVLNTEPITIYDDDDGDGIFGV